MAFENNVQGTLQANLAIGAITVNVLKAVAPNKDVPTSGRLTLSATDKTEIISYTGRTDNTTYWTLTGVTKNAESSFGDQAWSAGDSFFQALTAADVGNFTTIQSATAPTNPSIGTKWFNTTTGVLQEYLSDGTDSAWLDISAGAVLMAASTSATVIAPIAQGRISTEASGTAAGCSYSAYSSGNTTVTFNTAMADTNYSVITDKENFDAHQVIVSSRTTTSFVLQSKDTAGTGNMSPSSWPYAFVVYASDPVQNVIANKGDTGDTGGTGPAGADGSGSGVETGTTLPSPVSAEGSLFYTTGDAQLYLSDGAAWNLLTNSAPVPVGGTVVIPSVYESGTYSYNLGLSFLDDSHIDSQLTYSLDSGTLPSGSVLPVQGTTNLTGTASLVSVDTLFTFVIRASDPNGASSFQAYQLTLLNRVPTATGGTVTIAGVDGDSSAVYDTNTNFTFTVGAVASTFSVQSGNLPTGTSLNTSTGIISGIANNATTTYTFTIRATDTDGYTVDQMYSWGITYAAPPFAGTGGTITTISGYKVHTFTSSGTFTTNMAGTVEVLIVGGGAAGGAFVSGGGGGAGAMYTKTDLSVAGQAYTIVVGSGGAGASAGRGNNGFASTAFSVTAAGGGGGGSHGGVNAAAGANGGGAGSNGSNAGTGTLTAYSGWTGHGGNSGGGPGVNYTGGGGGGAYFAGTAGTQVVGGEGNGGNGVLSNINGSNLYWAGGGGSGELSVAGIGGGLGGLGGGGGGSDFEDLSHGAGGTGGLNNGGAGSFSSPQGTGGNGGANTGSGGGGGSDTTGSNGAGGSGGSGIVIVRYAV